MTSAIALVTFIEIYDPKLVPASGDITNASNKPTLNTIINKNKT